MTQLAISQQFCPQCGKPASIHQRFCPHCGKKMDASSSQSIQPDYRQDADATIRAAARLSSAVHEKAVQQSLASPTSGQLQQHEVRISPDKKQLLERQQRKKYSVKKRVVQIGCGLGLLLVLMLLVYGAINHSGNAQAQQQAQQNKARLDRLIQYSNSIGIPASFLQPVMRQEQHLSNSNALLTAIDSLTPNYYRNLAASYHTLFVQATGIISTATDQLQSQAQRDMQNFQSALSRTNTLAIGNIHYFSQQFSQDQLSLSSASYPKDYVTISNDARNAIEALGAMQSTFNQLTNFKNALAKLQAARLDITAMQNLYQNDLQDFNSATTLLDFQNLSAQMNAQYQQVIVDSVQAFPYIAVTKLNELTTQIRQLKTYGLDASFYQARLDADQAAMEHAKTIYKELVFLDQVDTDIASMQSDLVQGEARYLVKQFHSEVDSWAKAHPYHDSFDGQNYALDNGYMHNGIAGGIDGDLASADNTADFETVVVEVKNALFNLHMLEKDYNDTTPYNQAHTTDTQLIDYYNLQQKQVLMVSLVEQVMRVYQNGKLVRSFYVTTGRQELPSPPGVWTVLDRKSPAIFQSGEPRGSPYWFPDTPINYAILYHWGGDFVHDAPWRESFGPGTQFPHLDAGGNTAYNFDGSHGCINLQESDAAWVYKHTNWNTIVVVY